MKHLWALLLVVMLLLTGCSAYPEVRDVFSGEEGSSPSAEDSPSHYPSHQAEESSDTQATVPSGDVWAEAAGRIPYFETKHFLKQLNTEQMTDFLALYNAVQNFEQEVTYPYPLTKEENDALSEFLVYECPENMMYDREATYTYYANDSGLITSRTLVYCMDQTTYQDRMTQIMAELNSLDQELASLSDFDREVAVYRYIINTNTYNRTAENAENTWGLLFEGQAKCDGIALTFKWLMDMAGIPNYILTGDLYDHSDGHAWNVIQIDGQFYDVDITHDDMDLTDYQDAFIYGLLNVDRYTIRDQYLIRDLYNAFNCPGAEDMSGCYHARMGTFVYAADSTNDMFIRQVQNAYQTGTDSFSFQFETRNQFDDFLNNTQQYMDAAAAFTGAGFSLNWFYQEESLAFWCAVDFN